MIKVLATYLLDNVKRTNPRWWGILLFAAALYAQQTFATKAEVDAALSGMVGQNIPMRVDRLEVFAARHEAAQQRTDESMQAMREDIRESRTMQAEEAKNMERVLRKLDEMSRK